MIILLAASTITLTALQASINAPREAFRTCLKEASNKAATDKVSSDAYDAYVRNACSGPLGSFKSATMSFDMKNNVSRKTASANAEAMIDDFLASGLERYKYVTRPGEPAKQDAAAAAPPVTPQPTPAAQPK